MWYDARGAGGRLREVTPVFEKRDPQTSLLASSHFLPNDKRERLEADWPGEFRRSALPLIDEEAFREFYHEWNGRPNKPVQTVVGVLLLKEMNNLTDAEALGALDYDLAPRPSPDRSIHV